MRQIIGGLLGAVVGYMAGKQLSRSESTRLAVAALGFLAGGIAEKKLFEPTPPVSGTPFNF